MVRFLLYPWNSLLTVNRYHGKCLKIARGKVKEDEKYTCPICDWRVKIPRDAARPKLEDLIEWQNEIQTLPFQPEEEDVLARIIDNAQDFRNHVAPFCNPIMATSEEAETQRFYLRKIEGAEILLVRETNYFRAQLHMWSPVAPDPPPVLETSKSTRKPRPTKLQKLMAQHGVDDPESLPQALRTKQHAFKRKSSEPQTAPRPTLQPALGRAGSGSGTPTGYALAPTQFQPQGQGAGMPPDRGAYGARPTMHVHDHQRVAPFYDMSYMQTPTDRYSYMSGLPMGPGGAYSERHVQQGPFTGAALGRGDPTLDARGLHSPLREAFGGPLHGHGHGTGGVRDAMGPGMESLFKDLTNQDEEAGEREREGRGGEKRAKEEEEGAGQAGEFLSTMAMYGDGGWRENSE